MKHPLQALVVALVARALRVLARHRGGGAVPRRRERPQVRELPRQPERRRQAQRVRHAVRAQPDLGARDRPRRGPQAVDGRRRRAAGSPSAETSAAATSRSTFRAPRDESEWAVSRSTVYAEVRLVPQLLSLYADQKIAPDDSENREAYLLLTPMQGKFTVKAGQMFLPFGLRLQDDDTFVRQATGVNFLTPDDGVELGLELAKWSAQLAVIEGESGADDQLSGSAVYVQPKWRVGASVNTSEDAFGDREMQSVFGGLKTGPISWLAELSLINGRGTVRRQRLLRDAARRQLAPAQRPQPESRLRVPGAERRSRRGPAGALQPRLGIQPDTVRAVARRRAALQRHSEHRGQQPRRAIRGAARVLLEGRTAVEPGRR